MNKNVPFATKLIIDEIRHVKRTMRFRQYKQLVNTSSDIYGISFENIYDEY